MIVTLDEVKEFARIDNDEEDNLLNLLIRNAEIYIEDASLDINDMTDRQKQKSKLLALILVCDWYDNRSLNMQTSQKTRYTVKSLIAQLKYCK